MTSLRAKFDRWLPSLDRRIWLLSLGRLLSQIGIGFTLFYAPIFFVEQVGISATLVGVGIGSGSVSGILGRILGGSWADSPTWGRRQVLLLSALVSAIADVFLALAFNFPVFLLGNLLMGFGVGLYWPATEAVVADLTTAEQRSDAYAVVRLSDSAGLGTGVILGGLLSALTGLYRVLFVIDGITFLVFFAVIYGAIAETLAPKDDKHSYLDGWIIALKDHALLVYCLVNSLFTTYIAQVQSTLPIYINKFATPDTAGLSEAVIMGLFFWHVMLTVVLQLPIARYLHRFNYADALIISALLWGLGFVITGAAGLLQQFPILFAAIALGIMALATTAYMPVASALVVDFAPAQLRGVYLSVNSLCWAVGYFIGPTVGGWSIDQGEPWVHQFWLVAAASIVVAIGILLGLKTMLRSRPRPS